ncbi:glypican-3 isoform X2 [Synchiropus splendidus]|uniref:glypican-3 isoform X2 n=1 Tax=Synchiropus splendidus TaxID=270530 RepID=UPI00237DD51E|nr:glypican-3 isoform X2 [Synchiropus splendidus]
MRHGEPSRAGRACAVRLHAAVAPARRAGAGLPAGPGRLPEPAPGLQVAPGNTAARHRSAGLPNQRPHLLLQENGGALPGGGARQHGGGSAGGQRAAQAPHHPERRHISRGLRPGAASRSKLHAGHAEVRVPGSRGGGPVSGGAALPGHVALHPGLRLHRGPDGDAALQPALPADVSPPAGWEWSASLRRVREGSLEGGRGVRPLPQTDDDPSGPVSPGHSGLPAGAEPGHRGGQHHGPPAAQPRLWPRAAAAVVLPALPGPAGPAALPGPLPGADAGMPRGGRRGAASLEHLRPGLGKAGRRHARGAGHGGRGAEAALHPQAGHQAGCDFKEPTQRPGEWEVWTGSSEAGALCRITSSAASSGGRRPEHTAAARQRRDAGRPPQGLHIQPEALQLLLQRPGGGAVQPGSRSRKPLPLLERFVGPSPKRPSSGSDSRSHRAPEPVISQIIDKLKHINQLLRMVTVSEKRWRARSRGAEGWSDDGEEGFQSGDCDDEDECSGVSGLGPPPPPPRKRLRIFADLADNLAMDDFTFQEQLLTPQLATAGAGGVPSPAEPLWKSYLGLSVSVTLTFVQHCHQ